MHNQRCTFFFVNANIQWFALNEDLRFQIVHRVLIASSEKIVCTVYGNMLCARKKNIGLDDALHWKFIDFENVGYVPNRLFSLSLVQTHMNLAKPLHSVWSPLIVLRTLLMMLKLLWCPDDIMHTHTHTLAHARIIYSALFSFRWGYSYAIMCVWSDRKRCTPQFLFYFECKWNDK